MIYAERFQTQCSSIKTYVYSYIYICTTEIAGYMYNTGADPGFQVRGGHLKKIAPSGGRREIFWDISCEKSRFYAKKLYFFQF